MITYRSLFTLTFLVLLLPLAACEELAAPELATSPSPAATAEAPAGASVQTGEAIPHAPETEVLPVRVGRYDLYLGTSAELPGGRSLSFDAYGPEGRCPIGVDCAHAGEVSARFTVTTRDGSAPIELTLPGGDPEALPLHRAPSASAGGLLVYLVRLAPYPVAVGLGGDLGGAVRHPDIFDSAPPQATLVVRPCLSASVPDTGEECSASGPAPPVLTTVRGGGGGLATLAFRTVDGVLLDGAPLRLSIGGDQFELPLHAGPVRFADPDGTVVDQASYAAERATLDALAGARHEDVTVSVSLAGGYVAFPYVSGDVVESDVPVGSLSSVD